MAKPSLERIVTWGREEAAAENRLDRRQEEAGEAIRQRYRDRLAQTRGLAKAAVWLEMQAAVRRAKKQVEDEVAPQKGLFLRI